MNINTIEAEIFLVVPYSRTYTQSLPSGLMYIAAYLESQKLSSVILDFKGIKRIQARELTLRRIAEVKPKFIGITCTCAEIEIVRDICLWIREKSPQSVIVIGGPHASSSPQHFMEVDLPFDYLVLGEGETTFYELISAIKSRRHIDTVNGIAFKKDANLFFTPPREPIANLDALPFPSYDKVDMDYYCRPNVWNIRPIYISSFSMFTTRGCCYNCKFCVEHSVFGRKVRSISPERVVDQIQFIRNKYKVDAIYFIDEIFTLNMDRIRLIFEILGRRGIKILFGCQTRANLLNDNIVRFLKDNGCIQIDIGIESGSQKILEIINKQISLQTINHVADAFHKTGLRCLANMLINIPGETIEDIEKSVMLVKRNKYSVILWNVYTPFPGVAFERALELNDLNTMLDYPSEESIELLERKYKFGNYNLPIKKLLNHLYSITFHPKYVKFSFNPNYWLSLFKLFSFIFDVRYVSALLRSKRKMQYLTNLFKQKTSH